MTMMKIEPLKELRSLQEEMDRLFDRSRSYLGPAAPEQDGWQPPADIYEDEHEVVVTMEVPGVREEDIAVRMEKNSLIVEGERRLEECAERRRSYHRIERFYGSFSRSFSLPPHVDQEHIRASCEEGVLKIVLLKEDRGVKELDIHVSGMTRL